MVLLLDNGPVDTSQASRAALAERPWITVEWLPWYAPELKDIERSWRDLKRHPMAHQTCGDTDNLTCAIHAATRRLNRERMKAHPCNDLNKAA